MTTQTQTTADILASEGIIIFGTQAWFSSDGHRLIEVTFGYKNKTKKFSSVTDNMDAYQCAKQLEGLDRDNALLDLIYSRIEQPILDWCNDIDNN